MRRAHVLTDPMERIVELGAERADRCAHPSLIGRCRRRPGHRGMHYVHWWGRAWSSR